MTTLLPTHAFVGFIFIPLQHLVSIWPSMYNNISVFLSGCVVVLCVLGCTVVWLCFFVVEGCEDWFSWWWVTINPYLLVFTFTMCVFMTVFLYLRVSVYSRTAAAAVWLFCRCFNGVIQSRASLNTLWPYFLASDTFLQAPVFFIGASDY